MQTSVCGRMLDLYHRENMALPKKTNVLFADICRRNHLTFLGDRWMKKGHKPVCFGTGACDGPLLAVCALPAAVLAPLSHNLHPLSANVEPEWELLSRNMRSPMARVVAPSR